MCCNNFWKKITVFSVTLLIGFFAAEFFVNDKAMDLKVSVPIIENNLSLEEVAPTLPQSERKNCVPADSSLKYKILPYDGSEVEPREIDAGKRIEIISAILKIEFKKMELEKSGKKNDAAVKNEIKKIDRQSEELYINLQQYDNFPHPQTLLYLERCSEYGESMKVMPPIEK